MALTNVIMLSQIAGHVVILILSLCITIPMLCHVRDFSGHCLLFSTGSWNEISGKFDVKWASKFYCEFPIVTGFLLFFLSSIEIYRIARLVIKNFDATFLGLFLDAFFGVTSSIMTFTAAIMITLGFMSWCSDITQRFKSCEIAAGLNITTTDNINTTEFYFEMGIAQFGAWSSFAACVALTVFALVKLISEHQIRNMRASMYLERQRLMNNDDIFRGDAFSDPPAES